MANFYKDDAGHWVSKEEDGQPCKHKLGRKGNKHQVIDESGNREDIDEETYKMFKDGGAEEEAFDEDEDSDFENEENDNNDNESEDNQEEQQADESDLMNPNNPKYEGFSRSDITNAKEVDEGYTFTNSDGKEVKLSIIEYIPYGALQDGDNQKLYGIVSNYDGSDSPKIGAIASPSLEDAKEQLEHQVKLGIQGSDRYLGRGKYDEEFFNIIRDNQEEGDAEKYKERYGWDFTKPFKEHDFMQDDPYEKWKAERENRKIELSDDEYVEGLRRTFPEDIRENLPEEELKKAAMDLKEAAEKNPLIKKMLKSLLGK